MKNGIRRNLAIIAVTISAVAITGCGSDDEEAKVPTDVGHEVDTLGKEVDSILTDIDELATLQSVSDDILKD